MLTSEDMLDIPDKMKIFVPARIERVEQRRSQE